jgi:hypothetical protein
MAERGISFIWPSWLNIIVLAEPPIKVPCTTVPSLRMMVSAMTDVAITKNDTIIVEN